MTAISLYKPYNSSMLKAAMFFVPAAYCFDKGDSQTTHSIGNALLTAYGLHNLYKSYEQKEAIKTCYTKTSVVDDNGTTTKVSVTPVLDSFTLFDAYNTILVTNNILQIINNTFIKDQTLNSCKDGLVIATVICKAIHFCSDNIAELHCDIKTEVIDA